MHLVIIETKHKIIKKSSGYLSLMDIFTSLFPNDREFSIAKLQLLDFANRTPPKVPLRSYIKYGAVTINPEPKAVLPFESLPPRKLNGLFA